MRKKLARSWVPLVLAAADDDETALRDSELCAGLLLPRIGPVGTKYSTGSGLRRTCLLKKSQSSCESTVPDISQPGDEEPDNTPSRPCHMIHLTQHLEQRVGQPPSIGAHSTCQPPASTVRPPVPHTVFAHTVNCI